MIYSSPINNVHTGIIVDYHRVREGPNFFMVYYKNLSTVCMTKKEVRDRLGTARWTDTSKTLTAWVEEMIEKYGEKQEEVDTSAYVAKQGFGPEAHVEDPTANTRMVT